MTIQLTPEIEQILNAESSATGLSPAEITLRLLTMYAQSRPQLEGPEMSSQKVSADTTSSNSAVSPEVLKHRRAVVERILARRKVSVATFGPPEGIGWREWIHEGHRY